VALLHGLGVWRIAELEALPRRELSSRFGPELLDCLDRVTGRLSEPLPAWDPPLQFEVCWSAESPTVRPALYIAVAVSGAVQHRAGMEESAKIIAINIDRNAPIFSVAHYGIVGDYKVVLPMMIKALRERA